MGGRVRVPDLSKIYPIAVDDLIRIGRDHDGGYVVSARTVDKASVLIGLGINTDWSFESDFLRRNPTANLLAVDGSVSTVRFKKDAAWWTVRSFGSALKGKLSFAYDLLYEAREWWRMSEAFKRFFFAPNRLFVQQMVGGASTSGNTVSWGDLSQRIESELSRGKEHAWFVKMDIEGAEYLALPELLEDHEKITGMVIELHDCDTEAARFDELMSQLNTHFAVVHVHGNNHVPLIAGTDCPLVVEVTLINRRLVTAAELATVNSNKYPRAGLDMPNHAEREDYVLF